MTSEPRILNGRFRLVLRLGSGGQASVWLGEDTLLKRRVAIKHLVPANGTGDDSAVRTRAIEEARAMARVRHPVIVPIHDIFFTEWDARAGGLTQGDAATGDPWLVMEYVDGSTLGSLIGNPPDGEPLTDAIIARIGLDVLDGLEAVHRAGVVHRDVKPENILVAGNPANSDRSVFLVDFGIAKISGGQSVTRPYEVVGTPAYVAPERLGSGRPGPAADLWSLGVTLYCAVEGSPPFRSEGEYRAEAIRHAILQDEPLPLRRRSGLADIIYRMLVKDPGQRAKADEVRSALEAVLRRAAARKHAQHHPDGYLTTPQPVHSEHVHGEPVHGEPPTPPGPRPPAGRPSRDDTPGAGRSREGSPGPASPSRDPAHRPRMRVQDVRDLILKVGTDTGVAMLLGIPGEHAAAILAGCPDREGGDLLAGIASAQPPAASAIMGMLTTDDAARLLKHMRGEAAAVILEGMKTRAAVRILDRAGSQVAALGVRQMDVPHAARLLKAMNGHLAAAVAARLTPAAAADIFRADAGLTTSVLPLVPELERTIIARYLD